MCDETAKWRREKQEKDFQRQGNLKCFLQTAGKQFKKVRASLCGLLTIYWKEDSKLIWSKTENAVRTIQLQRKRLRESNSKLSCITFLSQITEIHIIKNKAALEDTVFWLKAILFVGLLILFLRRLIKSSMQWLTEDWMELLWYSNLANKLRKVSSTYQQILKKSLC